ncbi:MAG: DUF1116 domain-containing protein [Brevinemataceae bacterium]
MKNILIDEMKIINIGPTLFQEDYDIQGLNVVQVDWQPLNIKVEALESLDILEQYKEKIDNANTKVISLINESSPVLIDIKPAIDAIPNMKKNLILHAGPPISYENMAGPMKGAVLGALIFEELANTLEEAEALVNSGKIEFAPCNNFDTVGPMAGIVSASMPVHIVVNKVSGRKAFCTVNEGLGKVLRFGANDESVISRLRWIRDEFAPTFAEVLKNKKEIDIKNIITQALQMGDECHNRNKAATSLFVREIAGEFFNLADKDKAQKALDFIINNDHYFLNLSMPSAKVSLDSANNIPYSTIVSVMSRNGVNFGIKVSGLGDDMWFQGKAEPINGLLFAGYTEDDCCPDLGDSAITETYGIGGFAMATAPAIVSFVGGTVKDALNYSNSMYTITAGVSATYNIPNLNFKSTALGIDIRAVLETGIRPVINTGIAHKLPGIGQVGAGITHPPLSVFEDAIIALAQKIKEGN